MDADSIAALIDGAGDRASIEHVAACPRCRHLVASAAEAANDPVIRSEMNALERRERREPRVAAGPAKWIGISAGLAAAAAILVFSTTLKSRGNNGLSDLPVASQRDDAITSSVAPRILSPANSAASSDTMRWTSVARADLYRIRVWNPAGDVVWSSESRDTMIVIPHELASNAKYLWEVDARTGWDRWVSSDLVEFTLRDGAH